MTGQAGTTLAAGLLGVLLAARCGAVTEIVYSYEPGSNRLRYATRADGAELVYLSDAAGSVVAVMRADLDADADGLSTREELERHGSDPYSSDTDDDGVLDGEEVALGTGPLVADSDGDGVEDGEELRRGRDPLLDEPRAVVPAIRRLLED